MSEIENDYRFYINTKLAHQHIFRRIILGATLLFSLYVTISSYGKWDMFLTGLILLSFCDFLLVYRDKAYNLSHDSKRIYTRVGGCRWNFKYYPETNITYDDIELICEHMGRPGAALYQRFDHIRIYGKIDTSLWDGINPNPFDYIMIIPDQLDDEQGMAFLNELYQRRPDAFTEQLTEFMESGDNWQ